MSTSELIEKYKKRLCVLCDNKLSEMCNIRVFNDYINNSICCKCIFFKNNKAI